MREASVMIDKTEIVGNEVIVTLTNGVKVNMSFFWDYVHMHFSNISNGISAAALHKSEPKLKLANYVEISYGKDDDGNS